MEPPEEAAADPPAPLAGPLGSALLYCEQCDRETPHRIFRVRRGARAGRGSLEGVARCRVCRTTHPFESRPEARTEVPLIVSDGPRSTREIVSLPPETVLQRGAPIPGLDERVIVRRLDARDGKVRAGGRASELAAVWATRDLGTVVKVSVIEGRLTRPSRIVVPPETAFEVGDAVTVERERLTITALRARGRTWRLPGDRFPAAEVQRLYGRRTAMPPAGRSDWSSDRPTPRSRASSASRAARSRSSPGVTRARTTPRARTALSGAAVQRSWSW
ncbi:MAG TPA: HVO_0476 family zinc finger protein [Thermoplasmata archaeon]|nr:HVO_0476 family zinc finger protein [Thermoplasmata archaeon]